jgi:hypothetical protein
MLAYAGQSGVAQECRTIQYEPAQVVVFFAARLLRPRQRGTVFPAANQWLFDALQGRKKNRMNKEQLKQSLPVKCLLCERHFKSHHALRVHMARAHGPGWDTTGNLRKQPRKITEREKEQRRVAQARRRNWKRRIAPFVLNKEEQPEEQPQAQSTLIGVKQTPKFCPFCGSNIESII